MGSGEEEVGFHSVVGNVGSRDLHMVVVWLSSRELVEPGGWRQGRVSEW